MGTSRLNVILRRVASFCLRTLVQQDAEEGPKRGFHQLMTPQPQKAPTLHVRSFGRRVRAIRMRPYSWIFAFANTAAWKFEQKHSALRTPRHSHYPRSAVLTVGNAAFGK